jgi:hypothetical protein
MGVFKDSKQVYECMGELLERAKQDPRVGGRIAKSGNIIQFCYTDPDAIITVNGRDKPAQPGAYFDVIHGPCDLEPDAIMTMKADISHAFWHGKVDLITALSKKEIVAFGSLPIILKLLPAVQPLHRVYPNLLREKGYGELVLK